MGEVEDEEASPLYGSLFQSGIHFSNEADSRLYVAPDCSIMPALLQHH
jgi:hypothetical protein